MGNSKIDAFGSTLIDLTGDTVSAAQLLLGVTAHDKAGNPITGTYKTPSGTVNITANGTHNVSSYASANVNVPIKWEDTTVTGNGSSLLTVTGLAFEPLGFIIFPSTGYTWSTNQMICCGYANSRIGVYKTSGTNTTSRSYPDSINPDNNPDAGVSGSGSNWTLKIDSGSISFRNGAQYVFRYWGV